MEYIEGKLVVDELIIDPGLPIHVVIRIDSTYFMLRHPYIAGDMVKVTEKDLLPYKRKVDKTWFRPNAAHDYWIHGLVPRGGYQIKIGRAATEAEFSKIIEDYSLTEDDVSLEFTDTRGNLFGQSCSKSFTVKQIRVKSPREAMELHRALLEKGIEASSVMPDRINIRIE